MQWHANDATTRRLAVLVAKDWTDVLATNKHPIWRVVAWYVFGWRLVAIVGVNQPRGSDALVEVGARAIDHGLIHVVCAVSLH